MFLYSCYCLKKQVFPPKYILCRLFQHFNCGTQFFLLEKLKTYFFPKCFFCEMSTQHPFCTILCSLSLLTVTQLSQVMYQNDVCLVPYVSLMPVATLWISRENSLTAHNMHETMIELLWRWPKLGVKCVIKWSYWILDIGLQQGNNGISLLHSLFLPHCS